MKRFHVHVSVQDLAQSVAFYNKLFDAEPSVQKDDYAKWMLNDPRINFAISARGADVGVNHLGFQVESAEALATLRQQAKAADLSAIDESGAACCYANSNKYWLEDPSGIAWETFQTLGEIPVFGKSVPKDAKLGSPAATACCAPKPSPEVSPSGCCS